MDFNAFLKIPDRLLIGKKLPKTFFLKNFELSSSEKKVLANHVLSMDLIANIKPSNSNIPPYVDDFTIYEEIQIMACTLNGNQLKDEGGKIVNLFQKYIPYPILLFVEDETTFIVNTCEKRINLNDRSKRTIEQVITSPLVSKLYSNELSDSFYSFLNFGGMDTTTLFTLYSSYSNAIIRFQAAQLTGAFNQKRGIRSDDDFELIQEIDRLNQEIQKLTSQLKKETQLNKKVAMSMDIQKLRAEIENFTKQLASL